MTDMVHAIKERVDMAHDRIDTLNLRLSKVEMDAAVLDERLRGIQASLTKIENILSKIVWLFAAGIIGAIVTFVVKGGLNGF
ncbi:hemolysin XhlA family protein [Martelella mediterranea]|nr:hemolysin XhlA family protein [Martelella mediterranea]